MNEPTVDNDSTSKQRGSSLKKSKIGGVALVVLAGLYALLQPTLNERFGLDLPALRSVSDGEATLTDGAARKSEPAGSISRPEKSGHQTQTSPTDQSSSRKNSGNRQPAGELLYGILRETSPDRYLSPAGLQYNPGSEQGHRLEHLRRHTQDDRGRPIHGVFDGDMEGALATIDQAYQRAKKGQKSTKKSEGDRTIYTVDMGKRIGFVGGKEGARRRNPMARRVRIVLEGSQVITAFPQ